MLPRGRITEDMINTLSGPLSRGDIIIDGGNTHYKDDIRRGKALAAKGQGNRLNGRGVPLRAKMRFIGCLTRGGSHVGIRRPVIPHPLCGAQRPAASRQGAVSAAGDSAVAAVRDDCGGRRLC
ncbi:MAG: NAD(P)-binding domain-containing protein [Rhodopila sp.]